MVLLRSWVLDRRCTIGTHAGALHVFDKVYVGPTLTYDNANKLSLTGVTTPSTNLTVGTNTYDIGSAKDVYIKDQGTYKFHTNDGNQALLMTNVVSSDPSASYSKTVPLRIPPRNVCDSGDPYSDGSVTLAATNGHVYSDTATGTYTWGTLSSVTLTADPGDLEPTSGNSPGTAGKTEYKWTPSSAITNGRTLVVAGGGGGGTDMGGGGGAGGLLASTTTNHSKRGTNNYGRGGGTRGLNASMQICSKVVTVVIVPYRAEYNRNRWWWWWTAPQHNNHPAGNGGSGGGGPVVESRMEISGVTAGRGRSGKVMRVHDRGYYLYPGGGGGASEAGRAVGCSMSNRHGGDGLERRHFGYELIGWPVVVVVRVK